MRGLSAVFFHPLFYYIVWDSEHSVHEVREILIFGTRFRFHPYKSISSHQIANKSYKSGRIQVEVGVSTS